MWAWAVWEGLLEEMELVRTQPPLLCCCFGSLGLCTPQSKRSSSPVHPHCHLEMPRFSYFSFPVPMCRAQRGPSATGRQVVKPGLGAVRAGRGEARPGG